MFRVILILVSLTAVSMLQANVRLLPALPYAAQSRALQLDTAGNIYVAGSFVLTVKNFPAAFVAKLSPDGSQIYYFTVMSGSFADQATALALGSDGSAYVAGNTNSPDFPVTAGALQATPTNGGLDQGFLAKVNPVGVLAYSTFINGIGNTQVTGITLDGAGDLFLTGIGGPGFSTTTDQPSQGFVLGLNPGLSKILLSTYGYGGGAIALDTSGNIYVAGLVQATVTSTTAGTVLTLPPLSSGAFQSTHDARFCLTYQATGPGGPGGSVACNYQYVAKLNPIGTLLWATYVTGTYGAIPVGMAVDGAGNVIVAGTTNSDDYPVTPGAFQTAYTAAAPSLPVPAGINDFNPPPATGYITKVNATGTGLIWSTYFGGSYADQITGLAIAPNGDIFVSGQADSPDLPGLTGTPRGCRPSPNQELGFVARVAPDGATAGPAQLVAGAPVCLYFACTSLLYDDYPNYQGGPALALASNEKVLFGGVNATLASLDFSSSNRVSCVADPADSVQLTTVAPGQLLSLYGTDLAPAAPFLPSSGVSSSSSTFGVFFNGIAAPILYSSGDQINVQVPYEIAGQTSVQLQVIDNQTSLPLSETLTLGVVERQPAVFLAPAALGSQFPAYTVCGGTLVFGVAAVARNADGALNDCTHPASAGATVTVFLNDLGPLTPALATGALAPAPPVPLSPAVAAFFGANNDTLPSSTLSIPGWTTGVAQVRLLLPKNLSPAGPLLIAPTLDGTPLRERLIFIWTKPN